MSVIPEMPVQVSDIRQPPSSAAAVAWHNSELRDRLGAVGRYLRRNPSFIVGLALMLGLLLFSAIGALTWDLQRVRVLSVRALQPPSWALPFGSAHDGGWRART